MNIDYSGIKTFKACPQLYEFRYGQRLEPRKPNLDQLLGSAVHYALERFHAYGEDLVTAFAVGFSQQVADFHAGGYVCSAIEDEALFDAHTLGLGMLAHYYAYYGCEHGYETVLAEYSFCVPIPETDHMYKGRIDGVVRDPYGDCWIVEHKTAATFPDASFYALDEQSLSYQWAMQRAIWLGMVPELPTDTELTGWCYNGLRKAIPKRPALLKGSKDTRVSAAAIDSTYPVYLDTVLSYGFQPDDYSEILLKLAQRGNTFFKRDWHRRTRYALRQIGQRIAQEANEIARADRVTYPNPTMWGCPRCAFREPCLAIQEGDDVQYLLVTQFRTKQQRQQHPSISSEEDKI